LTLEQIGVGSEAVICLALFYLGNRIERERFKLDLLIEVAIIVELESVEQVELCSKQLLAYLRLADKPLGLLFQK
jgi:GxxExxY protein